MELTEKFIIDTNVPLTANKILNYEEADSKLLDCMEMCVKLIELVCKTKQGLVLDSRDEIFNEYCNKLSFSGQPGVGDRFFKWVYDNMFSFPSEDRVDITPIDDTYEEFPDHPGLKEFDPTDKMFIATANAHTSDPKPTIYQATDSKWWGWKNALSEVGISVQFLCEEYVKDKHNKKLPDR